MDKSSAETLVKVISVLYWIESAFLVLLALLMFAGGSLLAGMMGAYGGLTGGLLAFVGVGFLVFAALSLFVGIGIWKHKNWAKITAIILGVLGLFSFPFGTIFGIVVIYFFGFQEDVKKLFK